MSARSLKQKGFTLVEILIVVVILGILAAIVIPQFTSASEAAKASSMLTQLQSLRSQLELYQLQHNGDYPASATADFWRQLTEETQADGTAATATSQSFGPYLQKPARNALNDNVNTANLPLIEASTASPLPDTGATTTNSFLYNATTGEIKAIVTVAQAQAQNLDTANGDIVTE
ncbi:MAG: prepilin-type N-terminal cleavage/methylation domain-containing protein [Planctomycetota bacterium]